MTTTIFTPGVRLRWPSILASRAPKRILLGSMASCAAGVRKIDSSVAPGATERGRSFEIGISRLSDLDAGGQAQRALIDRPPGNLPVLVGDVWCVLHKKSGQARLI